ncbi:MAG: hypothetical protein QOJ40_1232 [Verrucomicrobiota bacterium]
MLVLGAFDRPVIPLERSRNQKGKERPVPSWDISCLDQHYSASSEPEPLAFLVHAPVMTLFLYGEGYQIAYQQERDCRQPAEDRHHYECITAMHVLLGSTRFAEPDCI